MNFSNKMADFDIEKRVDKAVDNFYTGYNCAQSVFLAYWDILGLEYDVARNMSVSFGAGVGRMREICGTVTAMAMIAGFKYPISVPNDENESNSVDNIIREMAGIFKDKHHTILCRELLPESELQSTPAPSIRTKEYYQRRPCSAFIADAARIAGFMLKEQLSSLQSAKS
ncbi:MAG: C-GCAxxG-C-C family protein [Parabacteroides sp.]|jgi:C_GCAxxG_C_C family probable redox protein|uniref:C_GCAxxG_C_C family probable redox protein n=1 Tax=Parabacteroides chartae TaxID=1037355 RepID=A0A1T5A676_9BACT|nr:C-GCAxxG-C-C family protein [Parabacteroides chartae]MDD3508310.1 C-GCAxxG-C-C family protein [Parabacteroides sp.]SKB30481.1 C_GCAxxG_C_C family probable redox protein [Parabacteroides chartae]